MHGQVYKESRLPKKTPSPAAQATFISLLTVQATRNCKVTMSGNPAKYYYIQSKLNGYVLDVRGSDGAQGTPIITWPKKDVAQSDNQLWYFVDAGVTEGQYTIRSKLNGMAIDIYGNGGQGAKLITWPVHGAKNQRWSLQFDGEYAFITSAKPGNLVIDILGINRDKGAEVIVWPKKSSGTNNQEWRFEVIPA